MFVRCYFDFWFRTLVIYMCFPCTAIIMFVFSLHSNNHACVLPTFQFLYQNCIYLLLFSLHSNNHTLFIHSAETSVSVDEKKYIKEIYMSKKKRTFWCLQNEYIVCWLASKQAIISFCFHLVCCLHLVYYFHLLYCLHQSSTTSISSAASTSPLLLPPLPQPPFNQIHRTLFRFHSIPPINTFFLSPYCVQNPIIYFLRYFFFALKREFLIERYSKIHTSKKK